jgi:hypothetical protein
MPVSRLAQLQENRHTRRAKKFRLESGEFWALELIAFESSQFFFFFDPGLVTHASIAPPAY